MRDVLPFVFAVACVCLLAVPALAADVTVKGEIVDIACATGKGAAGRGDAHSACALSCAREGKPLGVLTDEAIYEVTGDFTANRNVKLLDFIAKTVTITGEVIERDGKTLLNVKTIRMTK